MKLVGWKRLPYALVVVAAVGAVALVVRVSQVSAQEVSCDADAWGCPIVRDPLEPPDDIIAIGCDPVEACVVTPGPPAAVPPLPGLPIGPGGGGAGGGGAPGGGGGAPGDPVVVPPDPPPVCSWVATAAGEVSARIAGQLGLVQQELVRHRMLSLVCVDYDGYGQLQGQWDTGQRRWAIPVLVRDLERPTRQEMDALLPAPAVQTVPADGVPSAVNVPMFVATDAASWVSPSLSAFDPLAPATAVTVTAAPLWITFFPGDGSEARVCTGPGVLFDLSLVPDDPWVQAEWPDRCSHIYERRTWDTDGKVVPGRPWGWPASLTLTWEVTATSGTAVRVLRTSGFARPVVEIQTVIVDGGF